VRKPEYKYLIMVIFLCLTGAADSWGNYADLDDQSGGIAEGFGSWGESGSVHEPGYVVAGKGVITVYHPDTDASPRPTVFFISGWGRPAETYEKFFDFMVSHNYTVVNIYNYNPGSINTSYANGLFMIEQAAEDYSGWIDTDAVGLMGHSYGGGAAIWMGKQVFGELNWGTEGRRFIFTTAPWLSFLMTEEDLAAYPSDTKLHIQMSYDDVSSSADYVWNTDPRAIRAVYELINIPVTEKDLITVFSDPVHSYEYNGQTYTYDADHFISYTGIEASHYEPYDALDVWAINRLAHAMLEYVFEENPEAKVVALGSGSAEQVGMGMLPDLLVTDTPIVTRDENLFAYRCSESGEGTWGNPDIWKLQEFCEDSDGDGIIDELEALTPAGEAPAAGTAIVGIGPNPFNPRTTISFRMENQGHVSLKIFNLAGELVRTLVDGDRDQGRHDVQWNGRDDRGIGMSSGYYVARLKHQGNESSRSMVLIR